MRLLGRISSDEKGEGFGNFWEENQDFEKHWDGEEYQVVLGNFIHPWWKVISVAWHPTKEGLLGFGTDEGRVGWLDALNVKNQEQKQIIQSISFMVLFQTTAPPHNLDMLRYLKKGNLSIKSINIIHGSVSYHHLHNLDMFKKKLKRESIED